MPTSVVWQAVKPGARTAEAAIPLQSGEDAANGLCGRIEVAVLDVLYQVAYQNGVRELSILQFFDKGKNFRRVFLVKRVHNAGHSTQERRSKNSSSRRLGARASRRRVGSLTTPSPLSFLDAVHALGDVFGDHCAQSTVKSAACSMEMPGLDFFTVFCTYGLLRVLAFQGTR